MNSKVFVPLFLVAMILLAACNPFTLVKSIPITNGGKPAVTATLIPTITQIAIPSSTASPTQAAAPTATPTPTPTATLAPAASATSTALPIPVTIPCNQAGFVADLTFPDGTAIDAGDPFIKTWRLSNTGTCTWTTDYDLVFVSGSSLSGPTVVPLPRDVIPGDTIDLSVTLVAPTSSGTYRGNWMLRDANGVLFGTGRNAAQNFWVSIIVNNAVLFAVTSANTSVQTANIGTSCVATLTFNANIITDGAGTVTYYWQRSNGSKSPTGTLTYTSAGSQTITDTWTLQTIGSGVIVWDEVYVDQPNHQFFSQANVSLSCSLPTSTATPKPTATSTATPKPTIAPSATRTPKK